MKRLLMKAMLLAVMGMTGGAGLSVQAAADYFVVGSGTSDAHVRGIAHAVLDALARQGHHPHHVEGLPSGRWVLLDFVDFVVHLFHPEARAFYQLERLWDDAPALTPHP